MLYKKLIRDFWKHKGAYFASMILVLLGILVYNMMSMMHQSFDASLDIYYETYRIGDATLKVKGMPRSELDRLIWLDNIKNIEGRLEKRVRLLDEERDVIFHFMSYDTENKQRLNDIELMQGRMPDVNQNEIIMGNNYYSAMGMLLGDEIDVIINGQRKSLTIVGVGRSPEFIYAKKNNNDLISDPKTFDIVFMPYGAMSELFGLNHQINNIAFSFYDIEKFDQTKRAIEPLVQKYGIVEFIPLEDQISHMTTIQKLDGIGSMTTSMPMMFLLISGVIIYIVLKRIIEQERVQIGVLKACGITDLRILTHYITYAVIVALVGGVIGAYIGISSLPVLISQLSVGFNMPFITAGLYQEYIVKSIVLCLIFALTSGYMGAKNSLKLEPSEAMRPPIAKESKSGVLDRFQEVLKNIDMKWQLALRNIMRNKGRSLFVVFGVAITAALLVFPVSLNDMYSKMLFDQYEKIETYDMKITFTQLMSRREVERIVKNYEGITGVEPQMMMPVTFHNNWREEDSTIIGLLPEGKLYNLYDINGEKVGLTERGLILSHWVAEKLQVKAGDTLVLESPMLREGRTVEVKIAQVIPQYVGTNGYLSLNLMEELLEGKDYITALQVNGTVDALDALKEDLVDSKYIGSFDYSDQIASVFKDFMLQTTGIIYILVLVGMGIGYSVIYVAMVISLSERNRELATMLVVGFTEGEVHQVLLIEQFMLSILGILLGMPMGKGMLSSFAQSSSTEFLIMPSTIPNSALVFSLITTIVAILIPQWIARKKIGQIVVTEALNARE